MERILREAAEKKRKAESIQQEKEKQIRAIKQDKEKQIKTIENLFAELLGVDLMEENALSSEAKVEAWSGFINQYPKDNPRLGYATKRLQHWQKMARLPVADRKEINSCPNKMSFISGGLFMAGEVNRLWDMSINSFCMDQYEVTQAEYERVIGENPSRFKGANRPVEQVNWHGAKAYCIMEGKRLPTEWEWEKAAKSGTTTRFYWGNQMKSSKANFCDTNCTLMWRNRKYDDGYKTTAPVGSFIANAFSLYDMSGNVSEWTDSDHEKHKNRKVRRGGSWLTPTHDMPLARRSKWPPNGAGKGIGFRCAK